MCADWWLQCTMTCTLWHDQYVHVVYSGPCLLLLHLSGHFHAQEGESDGRGWGSGAAIMWMAAVQAMPTEVGFLWKRFFSTLILFTSLGQEYQ